MRSIKLLPLLITVFVACKDKSNDSNNNPTQKTDSSGVTIDENGKKVITPVNNKVLYRNKVDSSKPFLYLTWDDGPNEGTPNVTRLVKEFKIPISFFLVGRNATDGKYMAMYEAQKQLDHVTFHNHSWSHANGRYAYFYSHPGMVVEDFGKCKNIFNFNNKISRGPGRNAWRIGNINYTDLKASTKAIDSLAKANYNVIGWDIEWHFKYAGGVVNPVQTADQMIAEIDAYFAAGNSKIKNHLVLLAHDQMFTTPAHTEQLKLFFERLIRENKYNLSYITDYPECKGLMN